MQSRKSRHTWSNRQIWPWNTEWSRAKANRVLPIERTGHSKHPLPTTQEKTLHMGNEHPGLISFRMDWVFIGRADAKAETPILWPPDANWWLIPMSWLIGKDPDAGRDWGQEEKTTTEDEMTGWHHRLNGHQFEWIPGVGDDRKAWRAAVHGVAKSRTGLSDWTELNWTAISWIS